MFYLKGYKQNRKNNQRLIELTFSEPKYLRLHLGSAFQVRRFMNTSSWLHPLKTLTWPKGEEGEWKVGFTIKAVMENKGRHHMTMSTDTETHIESHS